MASLNKKQYEYRRESAARRATENKMIETLTEEQHDIIAEVARMRHEIHCNIDSMYNCESADYDKWQWIDNGSGGINDHLVSADLPKIEWSYSVESFPTSEDRYNGIIDNTDEAEEDNRNEYYKMMMHLNSDMEVYLTMIDREYGTNYAPTGELRK
jgi:hypothetical protein